MPSPRLLVIEGNSSSTIAEHVSFGGTPASKLNSACDERSMPDRRERLLAPQLGHSRLIGLTAPELVYAGVTQSSVSPGVAGYGSDPPLCLNVVSEVVENGLPTAALLLGGVRPSALVAGRRMTARNAGVLRRADALFTTSPEPYCQTGF